MHLLLLLFLSSINGQVPLEDFYPYGFSGGDAAIPLNPPYSSTFVSIPLSFSFPFFGTIYNVVHVCTNGLISFGNIEGIWDFYPAILPQEGFRSVAAYWVDSDPNRG